VFFLDRANGSGFDLAETAGTMRIWHNADGLQSDSVTAIIQTQDGFLWAGTSAVWSGSTALNSPRSNWHFLHERSGLRHGIVRRQRRPFVDRHEAERFVSTGSRNGAAFHHRTGMA